MTLSLAPHYSGTVRMAAAPGGTSYVERIAAWLPALLLLNPILIWPLFFAEPFNSPLEIGVGDASSRSYLLHKLWMPPLFCVAAFLTLASRHKDLKLNSLPMVSFILLFAWSVLSVLWALAPLVSASRLALQVLIAATIYLSFAIVRDPRKVLEPVFWLVVVAVFANVASVVLRPPGPIGHEGIYEHKNSLGGFCVAAIFFAIYRLSWGNTAGKLTALMVIPICLALLVMSLSKTSAGLLPVSIVIGIAGCAVARWLRISAAVQFVSVLALVTVGLYLSEEVLQLNFWDLAGLAVGDPTFTGRTDIWAFTLDQASHRPFGGFGFRSFWRVGADSPALQVAGTFTSRTAHAHNGYIDILLNGGAVAVALFLPVLVGGLHVAGKIADRSFLAGVACLGFMVFSVLYNLLETSWFLGTNVVFIFFQIVWVAIMYDPVNSRRREHGALS